MNIRLRESDYENYDYREFWAKGKREYEDRSERKALRRLFKGLSKEDRVFLDLGCGYGRLFSEYADFKYIILIDYSLKNLKIAKQNIEEYLKENYCSDKKVYFIAADVTSIPLSDASIDVVLTVRVLHHIWETEKYFDEVKRILGTGSEYYLEFANKRNIKNILRYFVGKLKKSPFDKTPLKIGETILNFHPKYIKEMLYKRDIKTVRRISVSNFRSGVFKKIFGLGFLNMLESIYQSVFSWALLGPSVFLKNILAGDGSGMSTRDLAKIDIARLLRCPACSENELKKISDNTIICENCNKEYDIKDGVFDFR